MKKFVNEFTVGVVVVLSKTPYYTRIIEKEIPFSQAKFARPQLKANLGLLNMVCFAYITGVIVGLIQFLLIPCVGK